jgi:ABC-type amino acid transport substrate-binding protein
MKKISILFFAFLLMLISSEWTTCFAAGVTIYFYNSETNIDNFATLKTNFDSYLSKQGGDYQFQPFNNMDKFEDTINDQKSSVYLLSSWHFNALQKRFPLKIAMIGSFKGSIVQRKVLCTKKDIVDLSMLKAIKTIAGAGSESYIRSILQQITGEKYKEIESVTLVRVPKDIDALMAVGFGMADAAISSEASLTSLEKINPTQYKQLNRLSDSDPNYLLVAATMNKPGKLENKLLEILYNMSADETSQRNLILLGLDGWKWK